MSRRLSITDAAPRRFSGSSLCASVSCLALALVALAVAVGPAARGAPLAAGTPASSPDAGAAADLAEILTREGLTAEGFQMEVVLAAPLFFQLTDRWQEAIDLGADRYVVFVVNRHHHGGLEDVTDHQHGHLEFAPLLRVDGRSMHAPSEVRLMSDDGHNRTNAVIFADLPVTMLEEEHQFEMLLPSGADGQRATLLWSTPIEGISAPATPAATPEAGA